MSPHVRVLNPNTTAAMTDVVVAAARAVAAPGTEVSGGTPTTGAATIESHVDEVHGALAVLDQVRRGEEEGVDAYVVACFGDTGVPAAREVASGPVVGMTEAAVLTTALVAHRFAVVTMPRRTMEQSDRVLRALGLEHRCSVRAVDVPVAEVDHGSRHLLDVFVDQGRRAMAEDDAEALVLGCAGLADLVEPLEQVLGVPVVDGVACALKLAEGMLAMRLGTSRASTYARPAAHGAGEAS